MTSCFAGGPCSMRETGGPCTVCGFPQAYAHPDCILEAFTVEAVFLNGTAMRVVPNPGIELGQVVIYGRSPGQPGFLRKDYLIPSHAKVGDCLRWEPTFGSPIGELVIHGEVVDVIGGVPLLRATHIAGLCRFGGPHIGMVLDTSIAPGTLRYVELHDGLHTYACYLRWSTNRAFIERGESPPFQLTPAQIAAGRLAYQRGDDPLAWHESLRDKVRRSQESDMARRVSVVTEQDID